MKFLKVIFSFLSVLVLSSCLSDSDPGIEQYYPNRDAGIAFLEANKSNEGIVVTNSGLQYKILAEGSGEVQSDAGLVKAKVKLIKIDGTVISNTFTLDEEELGYITLASVIPGVYEGVKIMNIGALYKFYVPYELAYGVLQFENLDPYSALIVEIELLEAFDDVAGFFENNALNENVVVTASGLQYEVIAKGVGENPSENSTVKVHYHGTFLNNQVFDSSVDRGETSSFELSNVIKGFSEGVRLMKPGAKYKFYMPSDLAYGENGSGVIAPNTPLIFEVELIEVLD
mgnify:CR=1 FL=1